MKNAIISVNSIMGAQMLSVQNDNSASYSIDLSKYSNGIYLVRIKTDAGTAVRKIIVAR
jgi:hypothetical protein